jgi:DNA-directed RNA polymerase specialized sigma24 family protein
VSIDVDQTLRDYDRWLHRTAYELLPPAFDSADAHDDLVQEGRIAVWDAVRTYCPDRGALPAWITLRARSKMAAALRA